LISVLFEDLFKKLALTPGVLIDLSPAKLIPEMLTHLRAENNTSFQQRQAGKLDGILHVVTWGNLWNKIPRWDFT